MTIEQANKVIKYFENGRDLNESSFDFALSAYNKAKEYYLQGIVPNFESIDFNKNDREVAKQIYKFSKITVYDYKTLELCSYFLARLTCLTKKFFDEKRI